AADVEIVATDVFVLEVAVLARKGVAVRQPVDLHVLDPEAGGALVPVIEVVDMDVVSLVEASAGPERAVIQRGDVAPFDVRLDQPRPTVIALESGAVVVFDVQRGHAFDAQYRAIIEGGEVVGETQLCVLLALIAESILGRCTR